MHRLRLRKVLVAVRHSNAPIVSRALGPQLNVLMCHSYAEALRHLDKNIGLIVCGVHFDGDHMFELLIATKKNPETCSIPFYVVIGDGRQYSAPLLNGIRSAALLLGATGFIDLTQMIAEAGEERAYRALREAAWKLLGPPGERE